MTKLAREAACLAITHPSSARAGKSGSMPRIVDPLFTGTIAAVALPLLAYIVLLALA